MDLTFIKQLKRLPASSQEPGPTGALEELVDDISDLIGDVLAVI